jgi:signal transduction histidine kinase/GAF domain-containing protein
MLLGSDRRLIYNDAYVPILGPHHPSALGMPFFEVWPEARTSIEPVIEKAFAGEASLFEDLPITLHRPQPQSAWFTFSYSPIRDEQSNVVGALCICTETTEAVRARNRQKFLIDLEAAFREFADPFKVVDVAQSALGEHFGVSRVGYGSMDDTERFFTTRRNWTDGSVPNHNGTHDLAAFGDKIYRALKEGVSLTIADTLTDPQAQGEMATAAFAALQVRSVLTVSLIKGGRFVAALYLHHHSPRQWTDEELQLVQDVAERTWSAVERAYAQANLRSLAQRQAFLLNLGDELRFLASAQSIKEVAARLLGQHLQVGRAGYGEIDEHQRYVTVERDWSDGTMPSLGGETRPLEVFGPAIIAELKAGRLLRLDSVVNNPVSAPYAPGYDSIGTKALLVVPLLKEGRLLAILYLHQAEPHNWTDDDAAIALEVAERTWASVERARAEQAVRELNAKLEQRVDDTLADRALYASLVEATDAPIQMIDRNYRLLAINPAAQRDYERAFGVRTEVGNSLMDLLADFPAQQNQARELWHRALRGESFDQLAWWGDSQLERRAYEMRFRPVLGGGGEVTGAYLIGRDVTDLLHEQERLALAEEQLRQAQKMEAMGQLTGGVAHDFNNLLTPIVGTLDMLQRKHVGGDREQRMIAGAAQAADRAKVLVQRLLAFARRQPLQPTSVDVGELVRGMGQLIASTTGPQVRVAVEVDEPLPAALADLNQLEMALLNLTVNARDAMPNGGTLRITANQPRADEQFPAGLAPGEYVCLSIADTGVGMDDETLKRAVEPFFSTKGIGKGTGLGLSMVHGLALQLGGALRIESRPDVGTNVQLWLPISNESLKQSGPATHSLSNAPTAGTALLVDDEELARFSTAEMLRDLGYSVVEAGSAKEALHYIGTGVRPDLLITDHLMPGMSGTDLAREIVAKNPQVQVLVVSGFSEVDEIAHDLPRLTKPFRKDDLAAALVR